MPKLADRVKETTTTTGTGAYSFGGAAVGYRAFSAAFVTTDTVYYCVENGTDWEVGIGTLTSGTPWTMARTTIMASSNAGAAVNWAAGTKNVFVTVPAGAPGLLSREVLTAVRTYYVATTGLDTNDGLAVGTPFLTIQKAVDVVCALDAGIYDVTIQVADGTYTGAVSLKSYVGSGKFKLQGNTTTPANVVISVSTGNAIQNLSNRAWSVGGFKLTTPAGGTNCVYAESGGSIINVEDAMEYGAVVSSHLCAINGAGINVLADYSVTGGTATSAHWQTMTSGTIQCNSRTITITGTPAFGSAWAWCDRLHGSISCFGCTFTGAATGKRYNLFGLGCVFTNGAAATYLPGNADGVLNSGAVYA